MSQHNSLPQLKRFITTHDESTGKAIFSSVLPEDNQMKLLPHGAAAFALGYTTKDFPVDLNNDKDISTYKTYLNNPPGLVASGGTVLRFVDCPPDSTSPMHRTVSLDYGVVIEGDGGIVELVLDSGEIRKMNRGDVAIQRGTMHAWRNTSKTEWARLMFVLQECKPVVVGGKQLGEDLDTMEGVPNSS